MFYDGGAARGANAASIPLAGTTTAPAGSQIEARIVRADTLAQVHPWQVIATAAGGTWSGSFVGAQRHSADLKAEVRVAGSTATPARTAEVIVIGHIALLLGQSEDARMFDPSEDNRAYQTAVPLTPGRVWFMSNRNSANLLEQFSVYGIVEATDAAAALGISAGGITASMTHLAATLIANAPNDRFLFVDAARSGTNRFEISNDHGPGADTDRNWQASLKGAVDIIRAWGGDVGVVMDTWTAADGKTGDDFRLMFYPFYSGMEAADHPRLSTVGGNRVTPVGALSLGNSVGASAVTYDHFLFDLSGLNRPEALFDPAVTKWAEHGPHRFEDYDPGDPNLDTKRQDTRISLRNMIDDADLAPIVRPKGPEILLYQNGTPTTTPGSKVFDPDPTTWVAWSDFTHPSDYTNDGLPARARHTALAALYALGVGPASAVNHHVPAFNRCYWEPSGAYVDLWYEAPDGSTPRLSTTRRERGDPAIPTTKVTGHPSVADGSALPLRTEVTGFYINAAHARNVVIATGAITGTDVVRVYPTPSASFVYSDAIQYGLGAASGNTGPGTFLSDEFDSIWKNLPLAVIPGITYSNGLNGIVMEPMPRPADIANTLPAPATFTTAAGGPWFQDATTIGANSGVLTFAVKAQTAATSTKTLAALSSGNIVMDRLGGGGLRLALKNSAGASVLPGAATNMLLSATLSANTLTEVVLSIDLPGLVARVWVNGTLTDTITLQANSGVFNTGRTLLFLADSTAGAGQFPGSVERLRLWKAAMATYNLASLGAAHADIAGPAATANAHPWRKGALAT